MEGPQSGRQSLVAFPKALSSDPFSLSLTLPTLTLVSNNFISKFADDTKICNAVLSGDRQEDLHQILDWSVKWEIPFNINKCQILQAGSRNLKNDYEMRGVKIKSVR